MAYVSETLDEDDFLRVFDRDGDGEVAEDSADERAFVRAVCAAETEVDEALAASHGAPFVGTVPDSVREIVALRCLWCAVRLRATMKDEAKAPYRLLYKDTDARLTRLASDNRARIPETGPPATTPTDAAAEVVAPFWGTGNDPSTWSGF
ncbi:MAG: hypothetical protein R3A48_28960 [Polyangiales bacterium]